MCGIRLKTIYFSKPAKSLREFPNTISRKQKSAVSVTTERLQKGFRRLNSDHGKCVLINHRYRMQNKMSRLVTELVRDQKIDEKLVFKF